MIRLIITPQPDADEAAAINEALAMLAARRTRATRRPRFGDLRTADDVTLTWLDIARREALGDVSQDPRR